MSDNYSICTVIFCGDSCCACARSVPLVSSSANSPTLDHCKINFCMYDVQAIKLLSDSLNMSLFRVLAKCEVLFLKLAGREYDRVWMYRGDSF